MSDTKVSQPAAAPGGGIPEEPTMGSEPVTLDATRADPVPAAEATPEEKQAPAAGFEPGAVIAAEPISMLRPGEEAVEAPAPKSTPRRRNADEMAKRPSWLPEDWKIDLRVRSSGATAGLIDRYFIEPTGQRRFRSRVEVVHFLETGSKIKRKATTEADDAPLESPVSSPKKAGKKGKKASSKKGKKARNLPNGDGAEPEPELEAEAAAEPEVEAAAEPEAEAEAEA